MLQGEVGGDTLAEYMQLEEKIARMETNRYNIPISIMVVVEEDPAEATFNTKLFSLFYCYTFIDI